MKGKTGRLISMNVDSSEAVSVWNDWGRMVVDVTALECMCILLSLIGIKRWNKASGMCQPLTRNYVLKCLSCGVSCYAIWNKDNTTNLI